MDTHLRVTLRDGRVRIAGRARDPGVTVLPTAAQPAR